MAMSSHKYDVVVNEKKDLVTVVLSEPPTGPILGLSTWSSSLVIANILHKIRIDRGAESRPESVCNGDTHPTQRRRILEIGAGTGLAGLSAGLVWNENIVLTDIADVVDNLSKSIALNADALQDADVSACAGTLNWNEPDKLTLHGSELKTPDDFGKFDVMLAADTVYDEDHPEMITNVIKIWLSRRRDAKFILGYPLRIMHLEWIRDIWRRLETMGMHVLQEGNVNIGEEWDDERLLEWVVWTWKDDDTLVNGV